MKFELESLPSYKDEDLLEEIRRVSQRVAGKLTMSEFDKHSKVHSSTVSKRLGGWALALEKAGIAPAVSPQARQITSEEIISRAQELAEQLEGKALTRNQFTKHTGIGARAINSKFGSWANLIEQAGLERHHLSMRYTDEDCYENLLDVWTHYGRQPKYGEMKLPPSRIGPKAYMRWGSWRKALLAFVERAESELDVPDQQLLREPSVTKETAAKVNQGPRDIPLRLRYRVLKRDCFKCTLCGASPAKDPRVYLHIDHIFPYSKGGATTEENLRVLCNACNLGKGDLIES